MPKRSSKSADINQLARSIVQETTGETPKPANGKNPAAVALGRLGGIKGGPARNKSLSKKRRKEIAAKAAAARWRRNKR